MDIINKWILSLIKMVPDKSLFVPNGILEDGMNLEEYIKYEKSQFDGLSEIYDLDEKFKVKVLSTYQMNHKSIVYFYIINKYDRIVCKMNLTIDKETGLLTGNNSFAQAVPKFTIEDNKIISMGLAIKPKYALQKVFCNNYDLISFSQGDNYDNDFFYIAKFESEEKVQNTMLFFTLIMKNTENEAVVIERKPVFFDIFSEELKPFKIDGNELLILNEKYPVHLSVWTNIGENENYEYPRNLTIPLKNKSFFTVTDSLDNDWIVKLK